MTVPRGCHESLAIGLQKHPLKFRKSYVGTYALCPNTLQKIIDLACLKYKYLRTFKSSRTTLRQILVFISSRGRSENPQFNKLISVVFRSGLKDDKQFLCGKNSFCGREEVTVAGNYSFISNTIFSCLSVMVK